MRALHGLCGRFYASLGMDSNLKALNSFGHALWIQSSHGTTCDAFLMSDLSHHRHCDRALSKIIYWKPIIHLDCLIVWLQYSTCHACMLS